MAPLTADEKAQIVLGILRLPAIAAELTDAGFKVKHEGNLLRFHKPARSWWAAIFRPTSYQPFELVALDQDQFVLTPMWPNANSAWRFKGTRDGLMDFLSLRFAGR